MCGQDRGERWTKVLGRVDCVTGREGELFFCRGFVFGLGWIRMGFGKERAGTGSNIY